MGYGGFHPYPRRFGGNRYAGRPLLEVVQESIAAQRGEAYDSESTSTIVWVENHAIARALTFDGWELNTRLSYQWDPRRVTDMLSRWEDIFKLRPAPEATDASRRRELEARWQRFGELANHARIETLLAEALGSFFVAVEYISLANAVVHPPDNTYPWGTVRPGITWYSTQAKILVRLQKPTGADEGMFFEAAGKVMTTLDPIVSAFCTIEWYRAPPAGFTSIAVSGGPSAAGFYLDAPYNLDNCTFDT